MRSGSTSSPGRSPTRSGRSPTASASRAASMAPTRSSTPRRCTSRMSRPTRARRSWRRTSVGTLILLEEAARARVRAFVMTSTTSAFGDALKPPPGEPAAWIDESVAPVPKNIYGVTKTAAEDLCQLFHRNQGLASIVLRTSRFFPEEDDDPASAQVVRRRQRRRRTNICFAASRSRTWSKRISSRPSARRRSASGNTSSARRRRFCRRIARACGSTRPPSPAFARRVGKTSMLRRGWRMFPTIDRVYDNALARRELGWRPKWDFTAVIRRLRETGDIRGPLAKRVGVEGLPCGKVRRRALSGGGELR